VPTIKTPAAPAAAPKRKRSKIVKLRLRPELLTRFNKKRKLGVSDSDRPAKRQSLEPNVAMAKSGLVIIERHGGNVPQLLVRCRIGREKLPKD
jgi:transcription initiation factor TFIID subunit 2